MYKVVRQSESALRKIADNKISLNFITKEFSPNVSLAITEGKNYKEEEIAKYNRIYFVLDGALMLIFGMDKVFLKKYDSCFISKGTKYIMSGTFKTIVVNQPAFGS